MAAHSNILTCRIPWIEEPGSLQSIGLQGVKHNLSDLARVHSYFVGCSFSLVKIVAPQCQKAPLGRQQTCPDFFDESVTPEAKLGMPCV